MQHPVGKELLADAQWQEGDVHWRQNLPYSSRTYAGDGFALVGDAGAFLDPLYSPGMDWISYTASGAAGLVLAQRRGDDLRPLLEKHNRAFVRSYQRWFESIYQDKYEYLGEFDLLRLAFLLDLGLYYMGVVSQPFKRGPDALKDPVFATKPSVPFYYLTRAYNRRFARIARARRAQNRLGRSNCGRRFMFNGYSLDNGSVTPVVKALCQWGLLELREGWRSWFRFGAATVPEKSAELPAADELVGVAR
jgi:hypothetical protein